MRILKIELQNINSLKSDKPIVIDFENEDFKDVGLYAITGSTGAGKTTILDAITIALYQNVPRFNNSSSKGTLFDVVSYGADNAFSRVTFENNNIIYEAYWGCRLATSSGTKLKNPKEEVFLKNISEQKTIANQKRKVLDAVEAVTQLNYIQFLRSVMLAQGEFASFLSAKGPEKGKLLEQITGEEIYKQIGEQISIRRNQEEKKLEELNNALNHEDILSDEKKIELKKRDKEINVEIKQLDEQLNSVREIEKWFVEHHQLLKKKAQILEDEQKNKTFAEQHKNEFKRLELNEKAEPFKPLLDDILRFEKDINKKTQQSNELTNELKGLNPKITNLAEQEAHLNVEFKQAEEIFNQWLPKFETLSKIDSNLKNHQKELDRIIQTFNDNKSKIDKFNDEKEKLDKTISKQNQDLKQLETYINQHQNLTKVNDQLTNWNTLLTTLKNNTTQLNQDKQIVLKKQNDIDDINKTITLKEKDLKEKSTHLEKKQGELKQIEEQLNKQNSAQLIEQKNLQQKVVDNWKKYLELSENYTKTHLKIEQKQTEITNDLKTLKQKESQLSTTIKEIEKQTISVKDAEHILNLQKSIKNYEEERKHLVEGEDCPLCGSKEHPYVNHQVQNNISDTQKEFEKRQQRLEELKQSKNQLDKDIAIIKNNQNNSKKLIDELRTELEKIINDAKSLNLNTDLSNSTKIKIHLNQSIDELNKIDNQLKKAQLLLEQKDNLNKAIATQKDSIHQLKLLVDTQKERTKNLKQEIENKQQSINILGEKCEQSKNTLTVQLSQFNYQLPSIDEAEKFINQIKESINEFNLKSKALIDVKNEISKNKINIDNLDSQIKNHQKEQQNITKQQGGINDKINELKSERTAILPFDISVEQKREQLKTHKEELDKKIKVLQQELQKLKDLKNQKDTLFQKHKTDISTITQQLEKLNQSLTEQLKDSQFNSKKDIQQALLTNEDKQKFTKNKTEIKNKEIEINTLKIAIQKSLEQLENKKNFNSSEEENQTKLQVLNEQHKNLLSLLGEIKEAFRKDQEIRDRNQETTKKIDAQTKICNVWRELFKIIGNSKDAFNTYVQRLTLKQLLDLANIHLYQLNKRYSLKMEDNYKPKEELNFKLIDHYQTDQARLVDTSSGGEKFIISLALALGLSDLASKNVKIDSLFIDEGFGTLDNNTLEIVISTLETLQSQGKKIGVISHVENLKERIPKQIQITKKSNGVSCVNIV